MAEPCRIVVMATGSGTNFQALIDAVDASRIPNSKIVRLFVNRKTAFAITRAEKAGIPHTYFNMRSEKFQRQGMDQKELDEGRTKYDAALAEKVVQESPDLVICAGWMHVFSPSFLRPLESKQVPIINLHPALPGKYEGTEAIERAFNDFQNGTLENNRTGIMIHHVIEKVDSGQVIMTKEIECREGESLDQLKDRIHSHEHELIVDAAAKVVREILAKRN